MAARVSLEANLDMQAAGRLAAALAGGARGAVLDGAAVTHLGGLAAQLLLAALRDGATLAEASPGLRAGAARLGLDLDAGRAP